MSDEQFMRLAFAQAEKSSAGSIVQFGIRRVVIGEAQNFAGNIEFLRDRGVEVSLMNDPACTELMRRFIRERPELWDEDIAGSS